MQAEAQRNRERKELEDRVSVRRALLEQKVCNNFSKYISVTIISFKLIENLLDKLTFLHTFCVINLSIDCFKTNINS